jgi:hypothetical protein
MSPRKTFINWGNSSIARCRSALPYSRDAGIINQFENLLTVQLYRVPILPDPVC